MSFVDSPQIPPDGRWTMALGRKRHQRRRKRRPSPRCPRRPRRKPQARIKRDYGWSSSFCGCRRWVAVNIGARVVTHRWPRMVTTRRIIAIGRCHYRRRRSDYLRRRSHYADPRIIAAGPPFDSASAIGRSPDATVAMTPAALRTGARLVRRARCSGASHEGFCVGWRAARTAGQAGAGSRPRGWACRAAWPPVAQSRYA